MLQQHLFTSRHQLLRISLQGSHWARETWATPVLGLAAVVIVMSTNISTAVDYQLSLLKLESLR